MFRLLAIKGPLKGQSFPIASPIAIGREEGSAVVLGEKTASRRHCELAPEGDSVRIRDLGSHNGTYVNGVRVPDAMLSRGDTVTVGDHSFLFLDEGSDTSTIASAPSPRRFQLDSAVSDFEMIGDSAAFRACLDLAGKFADTDLPILLAGETGTGKELLARWIHGASRRARGPFVALNSAAIPETLFEAEIFGSEEGAFTGATARRAGKFELASGGTLFLDEIGDLPLPLQPKLLRAVQEKAFYRVGGTKELKADARILAATNRDLPEAARAGKFREDLYHRLATLVLGLPPLRERKEDIGTLARHFAERAARRQGRPFAGISPSALVMLERYTWPGNIRELQNVIERAVILSGGGALEAGGLDLPAIAPPKKSAGGLSMADAEREAIVRALEKTGGKLGETAKLLGISWPTLRRKMKAHGIAKDDKI